MIYIAQIVSPIKRGKDNIKTKAHSQEVNNYIKVIENLGGVVLTNFDINHSDGKGYYQSNIILGIEKYPAKPFLHKLKKYNPDPTKLSCHTILFRTEEELLKFIDLYADDNGKNDFLTEYRRNKNLHTLGIE